SAPPTSTRAPLLPDVTRRFETSSPCKAFFYGNFEADDKEWVPYPPQPRYGVQYLGLRNCIGILSESYTHAPFRDRCLATRDFVRACLESAVEQRDKVREVLAQAREAGGRKGDPVPLVQKMVSTAEPVTILGWAE